MAALMLSANNNLTYRDVQQILLLSARHFDLADWDLSTNGAGLRVSHNLGFGVPDAAMAVQLARRWSNRPPQTVVTVSSPDPASVPDDGLRLVVSGEGVPPGLGAIRTATGLGPHADAPTVVVPLVDIGLATNASSIPDLTGKAALIQRGGATFAQKINLAAQAGCAFAVIYNFSSTTSTFGCPGGEQLCTMGGTDFVPVPAVFIGYAEGLALAELFRTNAAARAQLRLQTTNYVVTVTNTLLCEHVGVRVKSDHPSRGDLRITLRSPQGTRSVLQRFNPDTSPGPIDWTYWSTHHFYESSVGPWTIEFSDEAPGATGTILSVDLILTGVEVIDTDGDGLDDTWEKKYFGALASGPREDPDGDGHNNAREQVVSTDPSQVDDPLRLDITSWNPTLARLSWPGRTNQLYEILAGTNVTSLTSITNVSGRFPETEWFSPYTNWPHQFFELRPVSP
jgi:subtilisin-like proprotein convertase family protein